MKNLLRSNAHRWGLGVIILLTPLLLYASLLILPTHDDWTSLTAPDFNPFFIKERFLFYGYHWRPFDSMIGYVAGRNPQLLFPAFNHILVVVGHLLCACCIFRLLFVLRVGERAQNIATVFFFLAPATMATVLAVDSQNQVFALAFDIMAFLAYIQSGKRKYMIWCGLVFLSALMKENGLMWALICPLLAFGFDFIDRRTLKRDMLIGLTIMVTYAIIIIFMPKYVIIHPEYVPDQMKVVKNLIKFIFTTFITVDYIYLLHEPSKNLLLAVCSFLLTVPFFYDAVIKQFKLVEAKKIVSIILCLLIAIAPHIMTVFSMMHTYAGLPFFVLLMALTIDSCVAQQKKLIVSFLLFIVAALAIDTHLWKASVASGLTGKRMAVSAIQQTEKPVNKAYVVIIDDNCPKLSSFCVIPYEAFGWGIAAQYETNYTWPTVITDTLIERSANYHNKAQIIGKEKLKNHLFDVVWVVDNDHVEVIH